MRGVEPIAKPAEQPLIDQEELMYATIRRYSTKTAATTDTVDQFVRRIEEQFPPPNQ